VRRVLPTPADTHALGVELAGLLRAGDLVLLSGPLGAGKTALTQGIGAGLGVPGAVTSPTFVLARVHRGGRVPLVHVDAYRLGSVADVDDLDLDASADEAVTVVEWGHGLVEQLADEHLVVELSRADDDVRTAELVPYGPSWTARLAELPDRPQRRRETVRVLLLDDHDRVLLFRDSDTGTTPVSTWWMTPGGGIEDGEDEPTAVVRELAEETGLTLPEGAATEWVMLAGAGQLAFLRPVLFPEPAEALCARIAAHHRREAEPELAGIHLARAADGPEAARMPGFVRAYLADAFGA